MSEKPDRWSELWARSIDDYESRMIVGSEVREVIQAARRAESLVRELAQALQESLTLVDESDHDKRAPEYLRQQVRGIVANKIRKALSHIPKELLPK